MHGSHILKVSAIELKKVGVLAEALVGGLRTSCCDPDWRLRFLRCPFFKCKLLALKVCAAELIEATALLPLSLLN